MSTASGSYLSKNGLAKINRVEERLINPKALKYAWEEEAGFKDIRNPLAPQFTMTLERFMRTCLPLYMKWVLTVAPTKNTHQITDNDGITAIEARNIGQEGLMVDFTTRINQQYMDFMNNLKEQKKSNAKKSSTKKKNQTDDEDNIEKNGSEENEPDIPKKRKNTDKQTTPRKKRKNGTSPGKDSNRQKPIAVDT